MNLKAKKKNVDRATDVCQASRCKVDEGLTVFEPGVRFGRGEGVVVLCDRHVEMSAPAAPPPPAVSPEEPKPLLPGQPVLLATVEGASTRLAQEATEAAEILALVEAFQIVTADDMTFANECLGEVKSRLKALEAERKTATKPINDALKKIRGWFKPAEEYYAAAEKAWKERIAAWAQAQAVAQAKALEKVQAAHQEGNVQAVATAMTAASEAQVELPDNVTLRESWILEVIDPAQVPSVYCSPDLDKLKAAVGAGIRSIPGCDIYRKDQVVRRGA